MMVWSSRGRASAEVEKRIKQRLTEIGPILHAETMGIELASFELETGVAVLRFRGDCPDCEMTASMLRDAVEAHLRLHVPEVREVRQMMEEGTGTRDEKS
ncbi:MAG: NifU family protein [Gemmatimonadaceae bacterium]